MIYNQAEMKTELHLEEFLEQGRAAGRGNLLGIQPYMLATDYASAEAFYNKMDRYLVAAGRKGWLNNRTIAVLPEYIGTWLVAVDEKPAVYQAETVVAAMRILALSHALPFAMNLLSSHEKDRVIAGLFRVKAPAMLGVYQATFSSLARKHGLTIVAGSILLPSPKVESGILVAGRGPLYNVTAIYGPDGRAHPHLARKVFPTTAELLFTRPAPIAALPAFDTPAGRLGVLVCADSWYPQPYRQLLDQGVELLAVPSAIASSEIWHQPWKGYDGAPAPDDADQEDVGRITEGQAWLKYALSGRIHQAGARRGVNVFMHGELWDIGMQGCQSVMVNGEAVITTNSPGAALLNLWI